MSAEPRWLNHTVCLFEDSNDIFLKKDSNAYQDSKIV
jgi:hypothetical protein